MIVPMFKYDMLVHHQDKVAFIEQLMQLGLVQIESNPADDDATTQSLAGIIRSTEDALHRFSKRKPKTSEEETSEHLLTWTALNEMEAELELAESQVEAFNLEIRMLEPWGNFDHNQLTKLASDIGREIKFFEYPERHFKAEWLATYHLQIINHVNGQFYFIIFKEPGQELPILPIALPEVPLDVLIEQRQRALEKVQSINRILDSHASGIIQELEQHLADTRDQFTYHLAHQSAKAVEGGQIWHISAWCPALAEDRVQEFLQTTQTVYVRSSPAIGETPPVLLQNNQFARLFEPIGKLFSLPNYYELDLTVLFAPFFLLFFGLCQGDAGYGILIIILASMLKFKATGERRQYFTLGQLFGLATITAGLLSGTFFGIELIHLNITQNISALFLNQDELFNLALWIGFVQIIFGMGIQAYKQWLFRGFTFAISRISWILLLLSLLDKFVIQWIPGISSIILWMALAGIVVFGAPEKGWLRSMGSGLADLYNITGVLGDLLSYIRLFALGVASSILGLVVNSIALSMKDLSYIGFILFILVLLVGHGINFMLSTLSAFVHPMRLTFVEFYKNTGFIGGGRAFQPFRKQTVPTNQT